MDGGRCGKYISGGALCRGHQDCAPHAACVHHRNRSFCKCDRGYTCRRCEHHLSKLELGEETCPCDTPVLEPMEKFIAGPRISVKLTGSPWDAEDECEIRYYVMKVTEVPLRTPWTNDEEALAFLSENGTKLHLGEEGVD